MALVNEKNKDTRAWKALSPPLSGWVLDAVIAMGFDRMTPVQASTIPIFMGCKDVVVEVVYQYSPLLILTNRLRQ